jgi:uncharacterized membrane protein
MNKKIIFIVQTAVIAAIYFVLTFFLTPISFGPVQVRISEAMSVLVFFTPAAVPGLAIGCLISNLASPYGMLDIVFGTLATLLSAICARRIRHKWLIGIPYVVFNAVIVGYVLHLMVAGLGWLYAALGVGLGELLSVYVLGIPLLNLIDKNEPIKRMLQ